MAAQQILSASDLSTLSINGTQYPRPFPLRKQQVDQGSQSRKPFDSPNLSPSSLDETDNGSTSGLEEFHLERYSGNARPGHIREISRSTNGEEKQRPDLNIITKFNTPNMPMKSEGVKINQVRAKYVGSSRELKGLSVVSHKAVQSTASPPDQGPPPPPLPNSNSEPRQLTLKGSKRSKPIQRLQNAIMQRQMSPLTQRIPIGINTPKNHAVTLDHTPDSALPIMTPNTPAIVVTPAGEQVPWILQRRGTNEKDSASSTYSALQSARFGHDPDMLPTPRTADLENVYMDEKIDYYGTRTSQDSSRMILQEDSHIARPVSQGWWNVMLSPLFRAGSLASRRTRQPTDTPPVPPLPSPGAKTDSPALSTRSDPSFLISPHGTDPSPATPRRLGLASAKESTWSRWTEWEHAREEGIQSEQGDVAERQDLETEGEGSVSAVVSKVPGLAAEYFHACAIEQLTGQPYFECVNHDCAQQLPKLQSIHDLDGTKAARQGGPFDEARGLHSRANLVSPIGTDLADSPSVQGDALSPNELSPNVRQASVVPLIKARALDSTLGMGSAPTCIAARNDDDLPNIAAVASSAPPQPQVIEIKVVHHTSPALAALEGTSEKAPITPEVSTKRIASPPESLSEKAVFSESLESPGPMSPDGQKALAPDGAVPLSSMGRNIYTAPIAFNNHTTQSHLPRRPAFVTSETEYPPLPERAPTAAVTAQDLASAPRRLSIEEHRQRLEKEDATARRLGGLWRGRGCFPERGCMGRGGPEGRTKRRWILGIACALLTIIIVSIVLAVTLTGRGSGTPADSQWLNLTGYPAMPTGIMTIAAPNKVTEEKRCVSPTTMWSCAVPKENQDEMGSNEPDQPNFRFEITFRNGTVPANMTIPIDNVKKGASSSFTNDIFIPNPAPPNSADQIFMGNTTDNITAPFDGEVTPFYITFMPSFPTVPNGFNDSSTKRLIRRQSNSSLLNAIPAPEFADDGSAAPASLLPTTPYPISQPVRLYNRGFQDEHYGFYMYYEKSIYLSGFQIDASGGVTGGGSAVEADQDGGSIKVSAATRCTFAQTRFLLKIFTSAAFDGGLLSSSTISADSEGTGKRTKTSSATDFQQPGSFPYPASIALDRHGGDVDDKAVWCYGMDKGQISKDRKTLIGEDRATQGRLVNAVPSLLGSDTDFNRTAGGIDGGMGGCECAWQNWK